MHMPQRSFRPTGRRSYAGAATALAVALELGFPLGASAATATAAPPTSASGASPRGTAKAARPSWTIDAAITKAKEISPRLQQARAAQQKADWRRVEALGGLMPQLTVGGNRYFDQRYLLTDMNFGGAFVEVPNILPNTAVNATLSWTLFNGLENVRRLDSARELSRAAARDADWTEFRLEQDVRLKFFQALAAERLAEVADQNVKTLEDHLAKTQLLRRGGVSTEFDVLRTEAQLSEARSDLLLAGDNVEIARRALGEAIGIDDAAPTSPIAGALQGDLPTPEAGFTDGARLDSAATGRLDVLAARDRAEAATDTRRAFAAYWSPRVDFIGTHIWYNNLDWSWDASRFRSADQFGLQLTWTIFDLGAIARAQAAAAAGVEAERALRLAELRVPNEFDLWKRKYAYSTAVYAAKTATLEKSREAVRLAHEGYRAGARTNSEVLDAELDLFRARAGVVASRLSAAEAIINLELALGRKLTDGRSQ
jgi:outer membrane protein TolC